MTTTLVAIASMTLETKVTIGSYYAVLTVSADICDGPPSY